MSFLRQIFAAGTADVHHPSFGTGAVVARTLSGTRVSPSSAMSLSAYFAAIRNIAEDVGKLPCSLYQRVGVNGRQLVLGNPVANLIDGQANPEMAAGTLRETLTGNALGWGNGYAEIQRAGAGRPVALWPIHPSRVRVRRAENGLFYDISLTEGIVGIRAVSLPATDMLHLRGLGDEGPCGLSVLRLASESIGLGLAAQDFGAAFFGNGATPGGILVHPGKLKEDAQKRLRESWQAMHSGPENSNKIGVLEEGMKYERTGIPPDEAQFLETRQFQVEEIARWFRIPPHKIGHLAKSSFSNIEHQSLEYVQDTLLAWLVRFEREAERKLLDDRDRAQFIIEHNVSAALRGDATSRSNYYRTMISTGMLTLNEARAMENLNPISPDIGNRHFMQGAMAPVDRIVTSPAPAAGQPSAETKDESHA